MSDHGFLTRILLAVGRGPVRLFRNNTGQGWVGKSTRISRAGPVVLSPGDVVIRNARPLHAGLTNGGSDLVGWVTVEITPAHVGRRLAVFAALEAKEGAGRLSAEQRAFLAAVEAAGGIAAEVRSIEDAERAVSVKG